MKVTLAVVLAAGLWVLHVGLLVAALLVRPAMAADLRLNEDVKTVLWAAGFIPKSAFATVGLLVAARAPGNPIGWLFLGIGDALLLTDAANSYAVPVVAGAGSSSFGLVLLWLGHWTGSAAFLVLTTLVPLLFPDGRIVSREWRPAAALGVAVIAAFGLFPAVEPGLMGKFAPANFGRVVSIENPLGIGALAPLVTAAEMARLPIGLGVSLGCVASIVVRYRRSAALERAQLKWVAYAASAFFAVVLVGNLLQVFLQRSVSDLDLASAPGQSLFLWWGTVFPAAMSLIPIAAGIAILRYRLYDIDLLINRTLVYGALSLVIAATYAGFVVASQTFLRPLTSGSELAVAGSTLGTLALVQPFRDRIQRAVDRRFYRSRYDAARTLDAFSARMRDQVDIDSVRIEVLEVVGTTLRPASVSLWLRGPAR